VMTQDRLWAIPRRPGVHVIVDPDEPATVPERWHAVPNILLVVIDSFYRPSRTRSPPRDDLLQAPPRSVGYGAGRRSPPPLSAAPEPEHETLSRCSTAAAMCQSPTCGGQPRGLNTDGRFMTGVR
jgi:hypothetical protein